MTGGLMSTYNSSEKKHVKSYEELEFTDDFLFCKIMENNVDLCKELTELILNRKIGKIIPKGPQKAIEITSDGKGVRFDVTWKTIHLPSMTSRCNRPMQTISRSGCVIIRE
jgi:hypothetical protein